MHDMKSFAEEIHTTLGCTEPLTLEIIRIALSDIQTFDAKQRDYGSGNIAAFGVLGVLIRSSDKLARLRNLLYVHPERAASNEPVEDAWRDLSVYGMIARLVQEGNWK